MTKKPLPLIGRIQEKLATGDRPDNAQARPRQQDATVRNQADWLMERIRRTAAQFSSLAEHGGVVGKATTAADSNARRERALLLSYKLTMTAWRRREETANRDVVGAVRGRMIRELRSPASEDTKAQRSASGTPAGEQDEREAQRIRQAILDPADSDIAASIIRFEAGLPGPLTPFYGDLAPAFGGPCATEKLSARYGKMVRHLYESVEKKLDERERGEAAGTSTTRYAGAGT